MKSVFITGTDTHIGKTFLTAALLAEARERGIDAAPMKPIQTGCELSGHDLIAPDLASCLALAQMDPDAATRASMAPYRFEPGCSPHLAAKLADTKIDLARIRASFDQLRQTYGTLLVEGAGGVLVPLDLEHTMLDLIKTLGLPPIVVARPGLGTLNHTLLTVGKLRDEGLEPLAVVVVDSYGSDGGIIDQDNLKTLRTLGKIPVFGPLPHMPGFKTATPEAFRTFCQPVVGPLVDFLSEG